MAKMFYTLDETKAALGKNEEEIKQYSREGRLREFRDGPRLMFRTDQVESLKAQLAGGLEHVDLGPSDSGAPIGLVDSKGGSGAALDLADVAGSGSGLSNIAGSAGSGLGSGVGSGTSGAMGSGLGSGLGSGSAGSGAMNLKEDTALSADLGLSGTAGSGVPSPARAGSGTGTGGSSGSRAGINVFGDEHPNIDPMAQTAISSAPVADLNLESVGSGSGLLDLTRESDDTSLGAELLDEISPGAAKKPRAAGPPDTGAMTAVGGSGAGLEAPRGGVVRGAGIVYREVDDPWSGALGGAALGVSLVLIYGLFVLVSSVFGVAHDAMGLSWFADKNFAIIAAVCLAPAMVFFIIGLLISKSMSRG